MATREEMLKAMALIRDECRKHDSCCNGCPIDDVCHTEGYPGLIFFDPPCYWPDDEEELVQ